MLANSGTMRSSLEKTKHKLNTITNRYDQETFLAGYIDGLQAAIGILSNNSSTMSYTMEIDEMFGEDYARIDEDENTN